MAVNRDFRDLFAALNAAGASIDAVTFGDAWNARAASTYGDQPITIIGRAELIRNKLASGRPQDLADVELLKRHS
jgi:hypothetical protein